MKQVFQVILFSFAFNCHVAVAESSCSGNLVDRSTEALNSILTQSYSNTAVYRPFEAGANIGRLLEQLSPQFEIRPFEVLFLLYEVGQSSGVPSRILKLQPRTNREHQPIWNYHAVLLTGGQIIDLHAHTSIPMSVRSYLEQYFPASKERPLRWNNLMVRTFPSTFYFNVFNTLRSKSPEHFEQTLVQHFLSYPANHVFPVSDLLEGSQR